MVSARNGGRLLPVRRPLRSVVFTALAGSAANACSALLQSPGASFDENPGVPDGGTSEVATTTGGLRRVDSIAQTDDYTLIGAPYEGDALRSRSRPLDSGGVYAFPTGEAP